MGKLGIILFCGIGRCAQGFLEFFFFLNDKIAVFDGPNMQKVQDYFDTMQEGDLSSLSHLNTLWEGESFASKHEGTWNGFPLFDNYYNKRLTNRGINGEDHYLIYHIMGSRFYSLLRKFELPMLLIVGVRDIANQYRSMKHFYTDFTPDEFMSRLRFIIHNLDSIRQDFPEDVRMISVDVGAMPHKDVVSTLTLINEQLLGLKLSQEQKKFLKKKEIVGKNGFVGLMSQKEREELISELSVFPDFEELSQKYEEIRKGLWDKF